MPGSKAAAPVSPTKGPDEGDPPVVDPAAEENVVTADLDHMIEHLNEIRQKQSALFADDFKMNQNPSVSTPHLLSKEELDRKKERRVLDDRENQLMALIREQRGE